MMKRIGRRTLWGLSISLLLLFLLFIFCGERLGSSHKLQPELQTFQLEDGWGYKIMLNGKMLIYQPTIPAIETVRSFPSEEKARKAGLLVLERMKSKEDITLTIDDIIHSLSD